MSAISEEIKRELGQHLVFGFHGHEVSEDIKTLINEYHLGNVILMKRNIRDALQVHKLVRNLQQLAKESGQEKPLLIGIDQENGLVSAFSGPEAGTQFPGAMAIAATGSTELAFDISAATGRELKAVGINWAYSPVADVNSDARNPVIGVRSFGDNPKEVAEYASAVSRGLTASGIAPSAKHFPGHGDTHVDSHLSLPVINKSQEELEETELAPFKALVDSSETIASIMVGHMALPALTGDSSPASLSPKISEELLKGKMGYNGLVVTDCLEMDAISEPSQGGCGSEEGVIRSLLAGADIAMVCHRFDRHVGSFKALYDAVESGRVGVGMLKESRKRIDAMKDQFVGTWENVLGLNDDEAFKASWKALKEKNVELSAQAYRKSPAVIWGSEVLPLKVGDGKEIALFTPIKESLNRAVDDPEEMLREPSGQMRNTAGASYIALAKKLQTRAPTRHVIYSADSSPVEAVSPNAGVVIFVLRNANSSDWQKKYLEGLKDQCNDLPLVLVASCGPYDLLGEREEWKGSAYLATFEFTSQAFEALVDGLFEGGFKGGKLPVQGL